MSKVGRNDPCPCGSGRKYKHCCMRKDELAALSPDQGLTPGAGTLDPGLESPPYPPDTAADPRATERVEWTISHLMAGHEFKTDQQYAQFITALMSAPELPKIDPKTPVEAAQLLMYDAFAAEGKQRIDLAKQAREISPDCADAYVLLAEESVDSAEDAAPLFTEGIAAGERALGPDFLDRYNGQFWTKLETRPYLRARAGLARAYAALDRHEEAAVECTQVFALDPTDAQGISYLLLNELLYAGHDAEALSLAEAFSGDYSTQWRFNTALAKFRVYGDDFFPRHALRLATAVNATILPYLVGEKKPPRRLPKESEQLMQLVDAGVYLIAMQRAWEETPGAVEWAKQFLYSDNRDERQTLVAHMTGPSFFINPDPDYYDSWHCPQCHERTKKREDNIVSIIEPNLFTVSKLQTRYCERCDILTVNEAGMNATVGKTIIKLIPNVSMRPYLPLGIVSPEEAHQQNGHQVGPAWVMEHTRGFRELIAPETWEDTSADDDLDSLEDEHAAISPLILPGRYR